MAPSITSEEAHRKLYDEGMAVRRQVMGDAYVDAALSRAASDFAKSAQVLATEAAWGTIWTRPGLELKQRSMITITLLAALGKSAELHGHIIGALRNGLTETEIMETMLQVMVYAGMPTGLEAYGSESDEAYRLPADDSTDRFRTADAAICSYKSAE